MDKGKKNGNRKTSMEGRKEGIKGIKVGMKDIL